MTIIGQPRRRRQIGRGRLLAIVLVVLLVALLAWFYSMGGQRPLERVEKPVQIDAPARTGGEENS